MKRFNSRREFYLWAAIYYALLPVYFFAVKFFFDLSDDASASTILRYAIGAVVVVATIFLSARVDLLWLNYGVYKRAFHEEQTPVVAPVWFYLRSLSYYVFVLGAGILLFVVRDSIYFLLLYYLVFLYGTIVMSKFDYIVPSYRRYKRLAERGAWSIYGKQSA